MTETDRETTENKIRRAFQSTAFGIGLGAFFLGLGIQSSVIHAAQMAQNGHVSGLYAAMFVDTVIFLIGAAAITKGINSLGRALMLIAGITPRFPSN